ncbi:radical SAM protein [Methanobacterium sp. YSL]|nr:radical SAM protein [Methanobacterium sp. YSL]
MERSKKSAIPNYMAVMANQQLSRCKIASMMAAEDSDENDVIWAEHEILRKDFNKFYEENSQLNKITANKEFNTVLDALKINSTQINNYKPSFSYLDLKVKLAERVSRYCHFCEKACGVDRRYEKGGCGVGDPLIASEFLHVGEEPPLVPSHTVFFAGCNFNCVYCQNWDISQQPNRGIPISEENMALIVGKRRSEGSRNVNFVGGDPTPNLPYVIRTMQLVKENIPVVWNSNLYLSLDAMYLLDGFADLYLTDFKYGNNECAQRLSGIHDYMGVVGRNHQMAWKAGDMIIRHLVLPNHRNVVQNPS